MNTVAQPAITTTAYQTNRGKDRLAALAGPIVRLLNRPALRWLAELSYDISLRLNGFAVGFAGRRGLSHAEERFLARFLPGAGTGALVDVGANSGSYSREMRRLRADLPVIAFEPHPLTFRSLVANVDGLGIETVNAGLSDAPGELDLFDFAGKDGSTQASLSRDAVALFDEHVLSHKVTCLTLDQFAAERGLQHIAFLKIDTEGFDLAVLRGAARLLAERRIGAIQFEFIPANLVTRVNMRDFFEILVGYDLYRLCANGDLWPLPRYDVKRVEVFVIQNIIALPRGHRGL